METIDFPQINSHGNYSRHLTFVFQVVPSLAVVIPQADSLWECIQLHLQDPGMKNMWDPSVRFKV